LLNVYSEFFPYDNLRPGQKELIDAVRMAIIKGENLAINAPSGFGKTISTLAAALSVRSRILWFTRTHREAERVVEEARLLASKKGVSLTALALQSRASLCPMSQGLTPEEASVLCKERRSSCLFYRNFLSFFEPPPSLLLTASELFSYYIRSSICPYYAQLSLCDAVDIVAASFPFLVNPFARRMLSFSPVVVVVIDEVHGMPDAIAVHQSSEVTARSLRQSLEEARQLNIGKALTSFIESTISLLEDIKVEELRKPLEVIEQLQEITNYSLHVITESLLYWGDEYRRALARKGERPRSSLYNLGYFLSRLLSHSEGQVVSLGQGQAKLLCLDTKLSMPTVRSTILMSGTMDPILLEELGVKASFIDLSKYASYRCKVFLLEDVTSRFKERMKKMYEAYAKYIELLASLPVNMAVFFPSYEVLARIREELKRIKKPIFSEEEKMQSLEHEAMLKEFKSHGGKGGAIYLGVCGGRASEGVDFPGKELDVVFIAGIPFEEPSQLIEAKLSYYAEKHGEKGYVLAYIVPATRKVAQAVGRAFRGPGDTGIVVLGDKRFKNLMKFLPQWLGRFETIKWSTRSSMLIKAASMLGIEVSGRETNGVEGG